MAVVWRRCLWEAPIVSRHVGRPLRMNSRWRPWSAEIIEETAEVSNIGTPRSRSGAKFLRLLIITRWWNCCIYITSEVTTIKPFFNFHIRSIFEPPRAFLKSDSRICIPRMQKCSFNSKMPLEILYIRWNFAGRLEQKVLQKQYSKYLVVTP